MEKKINNYLYDIRNKDYFSYLQIIFSENEFRLNLALITKLKLELDSVCKLSDINLSIIKLKWWYEQFENIYKTKNNYFFMNDFDDLIKQNMISASDFYELICLYENLLGDEDNYLKNLSECFNKFYQIISKLIIGNSKDEILNKFAQKRAIIEYNNKYSNKEKKINNIDISKSDILNLPNKLNNYFLKELYILDYLEKSYHQNKYSFIFKNNIILPIKLFYISKY